MKEARAAVEAELFALKLGHGCTRRGGLRNLALSIAEADIAFAAAHRCEGEAHATFNDHATAAPGNFGQALGLNIHLAAHPMMI